MVHKLVLVPFVLAAITGAPAFGRGLLESSAEVTVATEEVPEGLCGGDWASIRAAYEAGRHRVFAADGGHRRAQPGPAVDDHVRRPRLHDDARRGRLELGPRARELRLGARSSARSRARAPCRPRAGASPTTGTRASASGTSTTRAVSSTATRSRHAAEGATGPLVIELAIRGGLRPRSRRTAAACASSTSGATPCSPTRGSWCSMPTDERSPARSRPLAGGPAAARRGARRALPADHRSDRPAGLPQGLQHRGGRPVRVGGGGLGRHGGGRGVRRRTATPPG